jgi:hypothetical protein
MPLSLDLSIAFSANDDAGKVIDVMLKNELIPRVQEQGCEKLKILASVEGKVFVVEILYFKES